MIFLEKDMESVEMGKPPKTAYPPPNNKSRDSSVSIVTRLLAG
jgi:hypothetical protein